MRIAIDATVVSERLKGAGRVVKNLALALPSVDDSEYLALAWPEGAAMLRAAGVRQVIEVPKGSGLAWELWGLGRAARREGADVVLTLREIVGFGGPPVVLHIAEPPAYRLRSGAAGRPTRHVAKDRLFLERVEEPQVASDHKPGHGGEPYERDERNRRPGARYPAETAIAATPSQAASDLEHLARARCGLGPYRVHAGSSGGRCSATGVLRIPLRALRVPRHVWWRDVAPGRLQKGAGRCARRMPSGGAIGPTGTRYPSGVPVAGLAERSMAVSYPAAMYVVAGSTSVAHWLKPR